MTKKELSERIAEIHEITKKDAYEITESLLNEIKNAMTRGERVALAGFGTFEAKTRGARSCVNPKTGEKMNIPACSAPGFKAAKDLKERLNDKK